MPSTSRSVTIPRGRLNALKRWRPADDPAVLDAQRELGVAVLAQHIARVLSETPLTAAQREQLCGVLLGGVGA